MTAVALAMAETRMLVRNRTAAVNAVGMPILFGALWIATEPAGGGGGAMGALHLIALLSFTVYSVATTTLVARRQQRALKRWRSSAASTPAILVGTLAPLVVLLVIQATALFVASAVATGDVPAAPWLLAVAAAVGSVLACALAFVTAAYTRTVEAAMISLSPGLLALFGGAVWTLSTPVAEVTRQQLATGGGAVAQLARLAWEGGGTGALLADAAPALAVLAALSAAAVVAAARVFRWEPRG